MAERDLQKSSGAQQPAQAPAPVASSTPGVMALQRSVTTANGKPAVTTVIDLLARFPEDRDAMMVELQQHLGNSYVQEVMVAQQKPEHQSWWRAAAQSTADAATLLYELDRITTFHPIKGTFEGTVDLAAALRVAQLVCPKDKLPAIALGTVPKGANKVALELSVYHKTATLLAPQLQIAGFANASMITGPAQLTGLVAHATSTTVDVTFARAKFQHVTFIRGADHLTATELEMTGLHAHEAGKTTQMAFTGAHVHGLQYPNAPAVDFDMPGGASMDAVWSHVAAPAATPKPEGPAGLPAAPAGVGALPQGCRIAIELAGAHAAASGAAGSGGFEHLHAAVVQGSHELASIDIAGFIGAGGPAGATESIRQLAIIGDPALVKHLLESPQIASNASIKTALDLAKSAGLDPAIGGKIAGHNITAKETAGGAEATGDFDGTIEVPQLGTLDLSISGVAASAASTREMQAHFAKMALTLRDHDHKEIAFLELDGGAASLKGTARAGKVKQLTARGNLAKIVAASDTIVKHAPIDIRGALQAVKSLGVSGDITGSLAVSTDGKETKFGGDFDVHVDAGRVGAIKIHVGGMHGNDNGSISFASFTAALTDAHGKPAASIAIDGAVSSPESKGNEHSVRAKKIHAHGEDATVNAMIAALQANASTLPAPVMAAFTMVRRFYANAGGSLTIDNAATGLDKAGHGVATAGDVHGSFSLHGAGTAKVALAGFRGTTSAASTSLSFSEFTADLTDETGKRAAHIRVEGSHDTFAARGKGAAAPDFSIDAKSIHVDGESKQTAALFAGMHAHLATLPQPIAATFKLIEQYVGGIAASGQIDVSDAGVASKTGKLTAHGTLEGHIAMAEGVLDAKLVNARSEGDNLDFDALDVAVKDPHGAVAASLHAASAHADLAKKAATLGAIQIHGDTAKLKSMLDPTVQRVMPAQLAQVLAMVDASALDVGATNVAVAENANGIRAGARTITAAGTIHLNDASGHVYTARGAQLEFDGANVVMDAKGKPREIDATAVAISGHFTSAGGGDALRGDAIVRTGAATIQLDANGAPIAVHVANLRASGDAARTAKGPTTPTVQPTRDQKIAALDGEAATAENVVQSIRTADIRARVPLFAGRYGRGLTGIGVPAGAAINIAVEVRNNALTNETSVHIAPPLDLPLWLTGKGIDLETRGREGALKLRLGGFFDQNVTKYVVGKGPLALDLPGLVAEVTGHMREGILAAEPKADDPVKDQKAEQRLEQDHTKWQRDRDRDVSRGADQRRLDKDAMAEPRGASAGDLLSHGVDLPKASASADVTLARQDGAVSGHLHGTANGGGRLQLTADALTANLGGNHVEAKGVDTGVVNVAPDATSVELQGLSISEFVWSRR